MRAMSCSTFLPATIISDDHYAPEYSWAYDYEPDAEQILDKLAVRYLESLVKQAVAENIACEMSARMIAMKNASDNAANLMVELELQYNKARQASNYAGADGDRQRRSSRMNERIELKRGKDEYR